MSLIVFLIVLTILVLVHEWGHYIAARRCGVAVQQFSLGFGPKLFSFTHDGTEFCLCAIPLGGYVKMAGDERGQASGSSDEFFSKTLGQRAFIVLMGPVVNVVLAFVCFWVMFMIGYPDMEATANKVPARIGQVMADSPAQKAGLKVGDLVMSIDGKEVGVWPDLQERVVDSKEPQITVVVQRDGRMETAIVSPKDHVQRDIFGKEHRVRRIGVGPAQVSGADELVIRRYGPIESLAASADEIVRVSAKTYTALYEMLIGVRSPKEAMGIVGMFFVIQFALTVGIAFLLHIVGVISMSLAIFNLLPIIPLDGGHLLLLGIEKLRGKALTLAADLWVGRIGFGLILALAAFIFYVDFDRIGLIERVVNVFKP